jgi:hypothetical protein
MTPFQQAPVPHQLAHRRDRPSRRNGATLAVFVALYQVSELFEITLVSERGRPAASSIRTTRLASLYES